MSRKTVSFQITFSGGAGTIKLTAIDGSSDQTFTSDGDFTANQSTGDQNVIAGGTAPAGGKITVDISCDGKQLKEQEFDNGQFDAESIEYEVPDDDDVTAMALASAEGKKK